MKKELGQSIGNIIGEDLEEANFQENVRKWRDGEASYEEVRQSIPSHDRPLVDRFMSSVKRIIQTEEGKVVE